MFPDIKRQALAFYEQVTLIESGPCRPLEVG